MKNKAILETSWRILSAILMWILLLLPFITVKSCKTNIFSTNSPETYYTYSGIDVLMGNPGSASSSDITVEHVKPDKKRSFNFIFLLSLIIIIWLAAIRSIYTVKDQIQKVAFATFGGLACCLGVGFMLLGSAFGVNLSGNTKFLLGFWSMLGVWVSLLLLYTWQTCYYGSRVYKIYRDFPDKKSFSDYEGRNSYILNLFIVFSILALIALAMPEIVDDALSGKMTLTESVTIFPFLIILIFYLVSSQVAILWGIRIRRDWVKNSLMSLNLLYLLGFLSFVLMLLFS